MRPLRIDLRGFTVFREPTTIDFTDTDFFALVGPTGSGKSTILDAITFALYGTVPRWGSGKSVAHALAPSASEAAVRLIFEAGGMRYAATRVVRRDGKGRASTRAAGLQQLTPSFDPSTLDGEDLLDELGEALAGTSNELDYAIADVVGLPYDQFIKCVVLPQGEFAAFLHARPAERQEILVRLLGLDVYDRVREKAAALVSECNAQLAATEPLLGKLEATAGDDALTSAATRLANARELSVGVETALPAVQAAQQRAAGLADRITETAEVLRTLERLRAPADSASLATQALVAANTAAEAESAVRAAEEHEEKVRAQVDAAAEPAMLRRLLEAHAELLKLATAFTSVDAALSSARQARQQAVAAARQAAAAIDTGQLKVEAAQQALTEAQASDRAAWLRRDLVAGHACPVCEQQVDTVPAMPNAPAMRAAKQALTDADQALVDARKLAAARDRTVIEAEQRLARAQAQQEQVTSRQAELGRELDGAPDSTVLRTELTGAEQLRTELGQATVAVRAAREALRAAMTSRAGAEQRLREGWRAFDTARDSIAALAPPPAERDDLATAWQTLLSWSAEQAGIVRAGREVLRGESELAGRELDALAEQLDTLFAHAGLARPRPGEAQRAAIREMEQASAAHELVLSHRAQAAALRERRAVVESDRQVASALANHLRANNFEAWLLEEALDALVEGASEILRELSGGQYDLIHDDRDFFVVDHHDAGLRRAVRTLSGGETFQASLALALALADQLGGLSPTASLESIILDEGFGTLDASTLDTVAATLENLAASGDRMVGVVTHVQSLAERIPVRFEISKDARTARVERIG